MAPPQDDRGSGTCHSRCRQTCAGRPSQRAGLLWMQLSSNRSLLGMPRPWYRSFRAAELPSHRAIEPRSKHRTTTAILGESAFRRSVPRMRRQPIDHVANVIAIVTFVLVVIRALRTVDTNWDTLQYHWAYAARAAGLCDRSCFAMDFGTEQRYLAFPMLFHTMYGVLWRIFGTPAAGHAVTIAVVVALIVYWWRRFAVPLAWSWLALLAIPLVQIHLSTSYVDLAANAALTLGIFALLRICVASDLSSARLDIAVGWIALTVAA